MRQPTTTARMLQAQQRRAFVVALRQTGATYQAIYYAARRHFGPTLPPSYTPRRVHEDVMRALQTQQAEMAEHLLQVRVLELARLDRMLLGVWDRASQGDCQAISTVLAIMARRARYLPGLEGPVQVAQTMPGAQPPPALLSEEEHRAVVVDLVAYGRDVLARGHNVDAPVEPEQ